MKLSRQTRRRIKFGGIAVAAAGAVLASGALVAASTRAQYEPPVSDRVASAYASYTPATPTIAPRTRPVVTFIGDSYTGGSAMGGNKEKNYSHLVAKHFDWIYVNQGIGGTGYIAPGGGTEPRTFGSAPQVYRVTMLDRPSIVFLVDGVNDLGKPLDDLAAAVDKTIKSYAAAAQKSEIVVVGYIAPGPANKKFLDANQVLKAAAEKNGVTFWDPAAEDWLKGKSELIGSDQFHLTDAGHEYLAQVMIDHITAAGLDVKAREIIANWGARD